MTIADRLPTIAAEFRRLLPRGPIWEFALGSIADLALTGLSLPIAAVEDLVDRFVLEADPRTTVEFLPDFERVYGLPDCTATSTSLVARRAAVLRKMNSPIGQTEAALISVVQNFGLNCEIDTFDAAVIDEAEIGDMLYDEAWEHALEFHLPNPPVVFFEADWSGAGDPLAEDVTDALECALAAVAPAHAVLLFTYDLPLPSGYQPWDPWEAAPLRAEIEVGAPAPLIEES